MPAWVPLVAISLIFTIALFTIFTTFTEPWRAIPRLICVGMGVIIAVSKVTNMMSLALILIAMAFLLAVSGLNLKQATRAQA